MLKTSCATQTVALNISNPFYRAWHAGPLCNFWLYGVTKSLGHLLLCFILLSHFVEVKDFELFWSASLLLSVPLMLEYYQNFLSDNLCFEYAKEREISLCEKVKVLSTGSKILNRHFNVLSFWECASFSYLQN